VTTGNRQLGNQYAAVDKSDSKLIMLRLRVNLHIRPNINCPHANFNNMTRITSMAHSICWQLPKRQLNGINDNLLATGINDPGRLIGGERFGGGVVCWLVGVRAGLVLGLVDWLAGVVGLLGRTQSMHLMR
jgi:hypothetical protein